MCGVSEISSHSSSKTYQPSTVTPMLRAVPLIMLPAVCSEAALRSRMLGWASASAWARVMEPTLFLLGAREAVSMPAAFLMRTGAGGVLVMKLKERAAYTVMTTGIIMPIWFLVRSLNSLVNAMMLTPFWPRAGPTGGAGVALPAGIGSLIWP